MVTVRFVTLFGVFFCVYVVAAAELPYPEIPSCASSCASHEIAYSNCSVTDQDCLCHDTAYATKVQACVLQNCTVKEALVARNQSSTACRVPITEPAHVYQWFPGVLFALPTFLMIGRLANKWLHISPWGWDDSSIVAAYLILAAFLPASVFALRAGAGRDIWTLDPDQITDLLLIVYIFGLLYFFGLAFIKMSIIFLYFRIFPDEKFRKVLWATQVFNLLLLISFAAGQLALCQPLNFVWVGWTKEFPGKCFDRNGFIIAHGAINVALDLWMLALPLTQLYGLHMQRRKKLGVMFMFSLGAFLTAVSAYRIKVVLEFATSLNFSADSLGTSLWSHIELCTGVVVACLPSARQLWMRGIPNIVRRTPKTTPDESPEASRSREPNAKSNVEITTFQDNFGRNSYTEETRII
ncbi:CFEM domain-containing protein [Colletotrichum navitas]|uniref:CFEM domain-containing protein n=1 Tax=Colletotrichum navitas TaxID=681940 RepID=A0AAD8UVA7_9PEZI|nr:CFEM domain-containing protein [Colletotrichum navitas]KAK1558151.1 CFEM domain-containing protein [Colletotrichum navitas]